MALQHTYWAVAAAAFGIGLVAGKPADAAFTFTFSQQGADVVVTGSGSLNTSALRQIGSPYFVGGGVVPANAFVGMMGLVSEFGAFGGPTSFGTGLLSPLPTSQSGDVVGIHGAFASLWLPATYVSGAPLSNTITFANTTMTTLGLTPGTYVWNWGQDATADTFTVVIPGNTVAAVPEPATALLFGAGLLGLIAARRRA